MAKAPVARTDVSRFLAEVRKAPPARKAEHGAPHARILFALDATASREPTWDMATNLHAELFSGHGRQRRCRAACLLPRLQRVPRLAVVHVACRPAGADDRRALPRRLDADRPRCCNTPWTNRASGPSRPSFSWATPAKRDHDALAGRAGQLAVFNLPCFVFQEGADPVASRAFRDIAAITRGAHAPFAPGSAETLRALFGAVAAYAARGRTGVAAIEHAAARRLLAQLP